MTKLTVIPVTANLGIRESVVKLVSCHFRFYKFAFDNCQIVWYYGPHCLTVMLCNLFLLLTEFEVHTVSYRPFDLGPMREARGP